MSHVDRLERDLAAWFVDTAAPRTPDYTDDIVRQATRGRQRPRWAFLERWLPMSVTTLERVRPGRLPWRTIGLLAILSLLLLVAIALYAGSRPRVPPPFGLAANGLIAYQQGGDIYTVDPASGVRRLVVTGGDADTDPRWSRNGLRLAFLRATGDGQALVVVDADGGNPVVSGSVLHQVDIDSVSWSPDGRSVAVAGSVGGRRVIQLVDASDGEVTTLESAYNGFEFFWRPPDGRQLLFYGRGASGPGILLYTVDGGAVETLARVDDDGVQRPSGWTPDGRRYAYLRADDGTHYSTRVVDITTGAWVDIPVAFGQFSNDGTRIAGLDGDGMGDLPCVARTSGGPCVRIGDRDQAPDGTLHSGLHWSPDDRWIVTIPSSGGPPALLDPDGAIARQPTWLAEGLESWQRAP